MIARCLLDHVNGVLGLLAAIAMRFLFSLL